MPATLQTQAIQIANQLIGLGQQLDSLKSQIDHVTAQWSSLALQGVLNAFPTAVTNTDGSLGTADGSPSNGHPINTALVPTLSRAISANDLSSLNTLCAAVSTLLAGTAVSQQGQSPGLLAKIVGG